jgi:hypothetical protein
MEVTLFRVIRQNRMARLAAIAFALNLLALIGQLPNHLRSRKSLDLWVPAADVYPYLNADTHEVVEYKVANVNVTDVVRQAGWPKFDDLYGVLGLNAVLFAWMLRLLAIGKKEGSLILASSQGRGDITDLPKVGTKSP